MSGRLRVKMCGMTRREDVLHAVNLGVDAIGLIFYPESSRYVSVDHAQMLLKKLPPLVNAVAVLVNPEPKLVHQILTELPIQLLQFHGEESAIFCQQFGKPYIKAIHADSAATIQQAMHDFEQASALLLDTPSQHARGGTGQVFNWNIIPQQPSMPIILAGGLNDENISEALSMCHPYAVDLCSGIEERAGIKDHTKMSRFMNKISGLN